METVWEYSASADKLIQHKMDTATNVTKCGKQGWPEPYDPDQDTWFGDHDRAEDVVICTGCYA